MGTCQSAIVPLVWPPARTSLTGKTRRTTRYFANWSNYLARPETPGPRPPAAGGLVDIIGGGVLSFTSGSGNQLPHLKGRFAMPEQTTRVKVTKLGTLSLVQFADRKILDELAIQEIQDELLKLVTDRDDGNRLVLSFANVDHLSSAALGMLITLNKR